MNFKNNAIHRMRKIRPNMWNTNLIDDEYTDKIKSSLAARIILSIELEHYNLIYFYPLFDAVTNECESSIFKVYEV